MYSFRPQMINGVIHLMLFHHNFMTDLRKLIWAGNFSASLGRVMRGVV